MLHVSGTGGAPKYGVVPQMPLTTLDGVNLMDNLTYMQPRVGKDSASIGRYTTNLANGVRIDFTASMHAGLINYLFPENGKKHILVDLSHYLPTQDDHASSQHYSNGRIDITGNGANYSGYGIWRGGWGQGFYSHARPVARG
jgi:putative alpha-1,2-mannosidase